MTLSPTWRLTRGQRLLHQCWDGECVLYNDLSGDTHLLDEFALALLEQLQAAPQSTAQLVAAFHIDPDADPAAGDPAAGVPLEDSAAMLHTVLDDLAALHLVESIPC
jgi:PqqD family protein of HPr-rel-A system